MLPLSCVASNGLLHYYMAVHATLREHIICLLDTADHDTLSAVVLLLERARNPSPASVALESANFEDVSYNGSVAPAEEPPPPAVVQNLFGAVVSPVGPRGNTHLTAIPPQLDLGSGPLTAQPSAAMESVLRSPLRGLEARRGGVRDTSVIVGEVRAFVPRVVEKSTAETEELMRFIDANPLFAALERPEREKIVAALDRQLADAGTNILIQGDASPSRFYLIFEGTVNVIKGGKNVMTMRPGQTFGELEMMYDSNEPNAATVQAVTDVTLWWLDRPTYKNIVLRATLEKRELYLGLLERVSFLSGLSEYNKTILVDALVTSHHRSGDYLIKFGERGQWMHFIVEGYVQVVGRDHGKSVEICRFGPGSSVGELEFLFSHPNVADVIAIGPVTTAKISRKHFELCLGPITDDMKRHVAKGGYEHYLKEADSSVLDEIHAVERKETKLKGFLPTTRHDALASLLESFDPNGEILFPMSTGSAAALVNNTSVEGRTASPTSPNNASNLFMRFPLRALQRVLAPCIFALREDGTIMCWSDAMERVTRYSSSDVVGQSIFSYVTSKDQPEMLLAIGRATRFAGDIEGYCHELERQNARAAAGEKELGDDGEEHPVLPVYDKFVFNRADGLTRSTIELMVVPPVVPASAGDAVTVLCVGIERKVTPRSKEVDPAEWLTERLKEEMAFLSAASVDFTTNNNNTSTDQHPLDALDVAARLHTLLGRYEELQQRVAGEERLQAVQVRDLVGQVVTQCQALAHANGNTIDVSFAGSLPHEVFLDATQAPEILRYGVAKAAKHAKSATITVAVATMSDVDLDFLQCTVHDPVSVIDSRVTRAFRKACGGNPPEWFRSSTMNKVREYVSRLGGQMLVTSTKAHGTQFEFRIPCVLWEANDDEKKDCDAEDSVHNSVTRGQTNNLTFTTLVVEERPAHRNRLNASLWERKHAVMPASSASDVLRLVPSCDIVVVDPGQSLLLASATIRDPIAFLRNLVVSKAVIITADTFDEDTRNAYHSAGFLTLTKPFTAVQAKTVFRRAEELVSKLKAEESKIQAMRDVFAGQGRHGRRNPWQKGRLLGRGAFGEVYEALDTMTGGKMAVKILRIGPKVNAHEVLSEIETMCSLRHKNIIHYFYAEDPSADSASASGRSTLLDTVKAEVSASQRSRPHSASTNTTEVIDVIHGRPLNQGSPLEDSPSGGVGSSGGVSYLHVFMELAVGGTLQQRLDALGRGMELKDMVPIARDIAEGLAYVHSQRFVHCDLKTANVLFGADGRAKLGDFGTARRLAEGEKLYVMQGTPVYMSPECMSADREEGVGYDYKADIWSFGAILLEMATGKPPLYHIPGSNNAMSLTRYITGLVDAPDLSVLFDAPPSVFEIVRACLDVDPEKRPTAMQLIDFSFFRMDGNDDLHSAMKALKRAQLLHLLNQFVAFREPEEMAAHNAAAAVRHADDDGGFFDSDDDEGGEDSVQRDASKSQGPRLLSPDGSSTLLEPPGVGKVVTPNEFFTSSSDEDRDVLLKKEEPKKPPATGELIASSSGTLVVVDPPPLPESNGDPGTDPLVPHMPRSPSPVRPRPFRSEPPPLSHEPSSSLIEPGYDITTSVVALHEALCDFVDRVTDQWGAVPLSLSVQAAMQRLNEQKTRLSGIALRRRGSGSANKQ